MAKKLTKEEWIEKARKVHGDKYDYSLVDYNGSKEYVTIICPIHGKFEQRAGNHLKYGCSKCAGNSKITKEEFIERASKIHNNKFDYSKVGYFDNIRDKITIICPIHGEFQQRVEDHMKGCGCNKCRCTKSKIYDPIPNKKEMREYRIWKGMKNRTTNPNSPRNYISKNITCCDEWLESFEAFYHDMGPCPENYSLDRIDNLKGYYKENCRWADNVTQASNRGEYNKIFTYNGETHVLKEWAKIVGVKYGTLYNRIYRDNLDFETAIKKDPYNRLIEYNGEKHILKEWCKIFNIKYMTVINRIHSYGWSFEKAITTPGKPFGS